MKTRRRLARMKLIPSRLRKRDEYALHCGARISANAWRVIPYFYESLRGHRDTQFRYDYSFKISEASAN
jgi:hypothetical protein